MSNAPVAVVGQNVVVLIATEVLLIEEIRDRLLYVEQALSAGRISEGEADELQEMVQALRAEPSKFTQEEEQSGARLTVSTVLDLHRLVWDAPRTVIEDVNWPQLLDLE